MKEKNTHILKKAIRELPAFKLGDEQMWERLTGEISGTVDRMPEYKAPEGLWEKIELELDKPRLMHRRSIPVLTRIAAGLLIVISIGLVLRFIKNNDTAGSLKFSNLSENEIVPLEESEMISIYNPALCQTNPLICNTSLFKELGKQLDEVKGEIDLIGTLIRKDDPQMMKYYYRLENLRVEIEKKMVKLILES